jgi:hypothetical protein
MASPVSLNEARSTFINLLSIRTSAVSPRSILIQRTQEIRSFCQRVKGWMESGLLNEVRLEIAKEIPELVPIQGEHEPVNRMFALFRGVSAIVRQISGEIDTVINPCSGSDISAGLSFGCSQLVTIDDGGLFDVHDKTDGALMDRLKRNLRGKLVTGMHGWGSNQGLIAYAMELVLNDVNLDTLQVVDEANCGRMKMTVIQFAIGGRIVTHTNFGRITLRERFYDNEPADVIIREQIGAIIRKGKRILLLSKSGGGSMLGPNIATSSFYPFLPAHSIVVSDANERDGLSNSRGLGIRLIDKKTDRVINAFSRLQGGPPPEHMFLNGTTDKQIFYGYAIDLRELRIYEVERTGC